jgi:Eukaryotic domain of unknown function (DUF1716).
MEDDGEAGPEMPPDFGEEDIPDDEEGRFFGGGMEQKTADAMQYIDQNEEEEAGPEKFDAAWVRRFALNFERKISKNAELRGKFRGIRKSSWHLRPTWILRLKGYRSCRNTLSFMKSSQRWDAWAR